MAARSTAGPASVLGRAAIGYPNLELRLTGAPTGLFAALNFAAVGATVGITTAGPARAVFSVPCRLSLVGGTIRSQWVVMTPGTPSPCAGVPPRYSLSERHELTFDG